MRRSATSRVSTPVGHTAGERTLEGLNMDDRVKAVIAVVLAATTGIAGVLAAEWLTGTRPGPAPASAVAEVDTSRSTDTVPLSSRPTSAVPTTIGTPTARPTSSATA